MLDARPEITHRPYAQDGITEASRTMWQGDCTAIVDVPQPGRLLPEDSDRLALKMVLSGKSQSRFDRNHHVVHPGQILVIPPNLRHVTSFCSSTNLVIVYVSQAFLRQAICGRSHAAGFSGQSEEAFEFPPHVRLDRSNISPALYEHATSGGHLLQNELLTEVAKLAACFVLDARVAVNRISATRPAARYELFRRVCIVRANIETDPLSVSSLVALASSVALSPFHLLRTFAQAFGETPAQMRRRLLIDRAKALLCGSDWPIGRIASATGFESHAAFCRAFRRTTGHAPTTYRLRVPFSQKGAGVGDLPRPVT